MLKKSIVAVLALMLLAVNTSADAVHTVVKGESMWKIATKYEVGLSEIISANSKIKNPELIYPGQVINIPSVDAKVLSYEIEVARLVNEERAKNSLKPLEYDWQLGRVARYKSQDMKDNNYFAHQSPVYGSPFDMIKSFGISYKMAGENIAKGQRTPEAVVRAWMNSKGHRANILNAKYTKIGVGYVEGGNLWTQMFIGE